MWFRRDLRLADHPALASAAAHGEVVPLFVIDPRLTASSGVPRLTFLARALHALDADLGGGVLVVRRGDPVDVVAEVAASADADVVVVSRDHGPAGRARDAAVADRLRAAGRRLSGVGSPYAVDPGTVTKGDGSPYAVFTPFSKAWLAAGVPRWRDRADQAAAWPVPWAIGWVGAADLGTDGLPVDPDPGGTGVELPPATATATDERWARFLADGLGRYDVERDLPALDGTSRLSAALKWGLVHPCQLLDDLAAPGADRAHDVFRSEIAWRDFYADVLHRRPETAWRNLQRSMDAMPVDTDARAADRFAAWCAGTTGFPIVDAGMRQLRAEGWMHNRVRMIVASFLVKDLHLPWQWGARHFMDLLVDGDLASNNHGWQWAAGTGTDAAPYFRVFNPTSQSERFDPSGDYLRRWVPELADLSPSVIHAPGVVRPHGYPAPIVDHATERDEALRRYRSLRSADR
jgi:deoxyribodipyrimidine photo-lyase